jgi:hypothetical protein
MRVRQQLDCLGFELHFQIPKLYNVVMIFNKIILCEFNSKTGMILNISHDTSVKIIVEKKK